MSKATVKMTPKESQVWRTYTVPVELVVDSSQSGSLIRLRRTVVSFIAVQKDRSELQCRSTCQPNCTMREEAHGNAAMPSCIEIGGPTARTQAHAVGRRM